MARDRHGARLYRVVAERIRQLIQDQDLRPGARLPGERALAQQLGVSRSALREGLIALELAGEVRIEGGSGVYVCAPLEAPADDVIAARRVVAGQVAASAARHAGAAAVDGLRQLLCAEDDDGAERAFMLALGAATGNAALLGIVDMLWAGPVPDSSDWTLRARAVMDAIAEHDHTSAARLMLRRRRPQDPLITTNAVIPAKAGIHIPSAHSGKPSRTERGMDSRLRGNDGDAL